MPTDKRMKEKGKSKERELEALKRLTEEKQSTVEFVKVDKEVVLCH